MVDATINNDNIDNQNNLQTDIQHGVNITSVLIIIGIIIFIILTYKYNTLGIFASNRLYAVRIKYITIFILYLALLIILYIYNYFESSYKYFNLATIMTSILIGCFLFAIVLYYFISFSKDDVIYKVIPQVPTEVINLFITSMSLLISTAFILFVATLIYNAMGSLHGYAVIIDVGVVLILFMMIYKVISKNPSLQSSPSIRLIVNTLLYIPCILLNIIDPIIAQYNKEKQITRRTDFIWMMISILLITIYYVMPYFLGWINTIYQGGKMLVNESISLNNPTNIGAYISLNDINEADPYPVFEYNYAISMWLYLDAFAPNTNASYSKFTPVFSYGGKPTILYKADGNIMMITAKIKDVTDDMLKNTNMDKDENGDVIIYKLENVLLQKWNNILINYSGGILDIFYNGELVKSAKNIVPYMELDAMTIGYPNGINGAICNVIYYKHVLDANSISYLYNSVKNSTPPTSSYAPSNIDLIDKNMNTTINDASSVQPPEPPPP